MFIVIEGPDGAGKSTQAKLLAEKLKEIYGEDKIVLTREPGGTEVGQRIRAITHDANLAKSNGALLHLMLADRAEHLDKVVNPALDAGKIVISDRYHYSTAAYQFGDITDKLPYDITTYFHGDVVPDITFFLLCSPEVARARNIAQGDKEDYFEKKKDDFRQMVYNNFVHMVKHQEYFTDVGEQLHVIDAEMEPGDIAKALVKVVDEAILMDQGHVGTNGQATD